MSNGAVTGEIRYALIVD